MAFLTAQEVDIQFPPYQTQENFLTQYFVLRHRLREPKAGPSRNTTSDQVAHFSILWDVKGISCHLFVEFHFEVRFGVLNSEDRLC